MMGLFDFLKGKKNNNISDAPSVNVQAKKIEQRTIPQSFIKVTTQITQMEPSQVVPVEKRIKEMEPICEGLYPHEVLVLSYAPKFYVGPNNFQGFWWFKFGVRDVNKYLRSLCERSYLTVGTVRDALENEKATALKEVLKVHGLKVSGKKADLVQRLVDEVPEEELNQHFHKKPYVLTEKGNNVLKQEAYIPYIHNHRIQDLDIWSLSKMVHEPPYMSYRDKIWGYLDHSGLEHVRNHKYGLYRNCRFEMSGFVEEEGKTDTAFSLLAEVICYDLSGLNNGFGTEFMDTYSKSFFPYKESIATMTPGITNRVAKYQKDLELSDHELKQQLLVNIEKIQLPFRLFTTEECADIVLMEMHNDEENLIKLYAKAKRRFNKE